MPAFSLHFAPTFLPCDLFAFKLQVLASSGKGNGGEQLRPKVANFVGVTIVIY